MEYPSKAVVADNSAPHGQWDRSQLERRRAALFETLVRACLVIVDQELPEHRLQVAGTEDHQLDLGNSVLSAAR